VRTFCSLAGVAALLCTWSRTALAQPVEPTESVPPSPPPAAAPATPPAVVPAPSPSSGVARPGAGQHSEGYAGPGHTCSFRAECRAGLRCLKNVCVEESKYARWLTEEARDEDKYAPMSAQVAEAASDTTRLYLGGAIGGVLPVGWIGPGTVGEGVQLALRFGVLVDEHIQFQLELSPLTTGLFNLANGSNLSPSVIGMFEATGSVGYLIPMSDMASWILRVGGGGGALMGSGLSTLGFAEFRADVLGVAIRTSEHLFVECNIPSFRVIVPVSTASAYPQPGIMLQWVTNVGVTYVF
jgi:hypothetical protein